MVIHGNKKLFPVNQVAPELLLPWLTHQDSLTEKLKTKAGCARLHVLKQQWVDADWWDKNALTIQDDQVLHREIIMWANDVACWYARTIIPQKTYQAAPALFDRLQTESLSELIFNEASIKRNQLMYYAMNEASVEYHWLPTDLLSHATVLWARLSTLMVNDAQPFFLLEILLPGLLRVSR